MFFSLISWQVIIAGAITALAISIIMGVLGVALGFSVVKPKSNHPTSGLGTAFGLWSVFSVVVSLAAGGFVAGMFSGVRGAEHGFMVWTVALLLGAVFSTLAVGGAMRGVAAVLRGVGSGVGNVASTVGHGVAGVASNAVDHLKDSVDMDFSYHGLGDKVTTILRETGIDKLQPDYLEDQLREAKTDLKQSLAKMRFDSDSYEQVISEFLDRQKARIDNITKDVDRDAAVTAVMNHRGIPRDEAEKEVDSALQAYRRAVEKAKHAISQAQTQATEAKEHLRRMADNARIKADRMASTSAKSALAAAAALIIGALVCCYAGYLGNRYSTDYFRDDIETTVIVRERPAVQARTLPDSRPGLERPMGVSLERERP